MGVEPAVDISAEQRETVLALLRRHLPGTAAWVYGSRAKWTSRPHSDLDLVVFAAPDQRVHVAALRDALGESDLPFCVDLFVWNEVPVSFREQIEAEHVELVPKQTTRAQADWPETRWGDIATLEYGRALRGYDTENGSFRVFGTNGPIGWHDHALCENASVIVGRKGAYRGIHYSAEPFFVIDTAFYLSPKVEMDTRWAYYTLLTQNINGMDSGSAIPSTSRDEFYSLPVSVPPLSEQRAIAHILGTLDDKIELNRRMNETLEAMARALFKSWFVDFDPVRAKMEGRAPGLPKPLADLFPNCLVDSKMGAIPEGWKAGTLRDVAFLNTESWKPSRPPEAIRYVDLTSTKWGYIEHIESYTWNDAPSRARRVLRMGDTIVSTVRPGNGSFALIDEEGLTGSTGFAVLRPKEATTRELVWCAATSSESVDRLSLLADGGAYPAVPPGDVLSTPVAVARPEVRTAFSRLSGSFLDRMEEGKRESRDLAALRDALLPKLISGKIRLRDAEDIAGAAA